MKILLYYMTADTAVDVKLVFKKILIIFRSINTIKFHNTTTDQSESSIPINHIILLLISYAVNLMHPSNNKEVHCKKRYREFC